MDKEYPVGLRVARWARSTPVDQEYQVDQPGVPGRLQVLGGPGLLGGHQEYQVDQENQLDGPAFPGMPGNSG